MKRWSKLSKHQRFVIAGCAAAVVPAAALGIQYSRTPSSADVPAWTVPEISAGELKQAFGDAQPWMAQPRGRVQAGIVPHHNLVAPLIAGWFKGMTQSAPSTVVILGPDHKNRGAGYCTSATVSWRTPEGIVEVDQGLVAALAKDGLVVIDPNLIQGEHGVYTAIPYIHHQWPDAQIVTIAVKGDLRPDRLAALAERLDELLGDDDLVLATVDFSHYTTAVDALRADEASLDVLRNGDASGALRIPVDSPPAISLILAYAKRRSLSYQQIAHTTSAQFTGQLDAQSTTSYVTAYFTVAP